MNSRKTFIYHLMCIFTVIIWGTTFVSTKILIAYGLTPVEIPDSPKPENRIRFEKIPAHIKERQ